MDVLISGCGIAGPSLAYWLLRGGHRVAIVEQAEHLRTGGYIIDFWGKGYDLAERMGLLPALERVGYHVPEVRLLDREGDFRSSFPVSVFERATGGRFVSLPRGELARILFEAVGGRCDTRFGNEVAALTQAEGAVEVEFANGPAARFDLVVGAEGIHSRCRALAFGNEQQFVHDLGYRFAAFILDDFPARRTAEYLLHGEPGRLATRFSLRDGSTLCLLVWREDGETAIPRGKQDANSLLRERFRDVGWEVPEMLSLLDGARDLYVDTVSQIRMERWHEGRVALVGDAAWAPSFLAGQGAALAMIGGYALAGELLGEPREVGTALANYEKRLSAFMLGKQDGAKRMGPLMVPRTEFGLWARAAVTRIMRFETVTKLVMGRTLIDQVELPDYFPFA